MALENAVPVAGMLLLTDDARTSVRALGNKTDRDRRADGG